MDAFFLKTSSVSFLLSEGMNNIGRDRTSCGIILYHEKCGKIHTSIIVKQNRAYLQVHNGYPVLLNKRRINVYGDAAFVQLELQDKDVLEIHENIFQIINCGLTETDTNDTDRE